MKNTARLSKAKTGSRRPLEFWHNGGDIEIGFYAQSLQKAVKTVVGKLEPEWD